jgi:hypothetical protein
MKTLQSSAFLCLLALFGVGCAAGVQDDLDCAAGKCDESAPGPGACRFLCSDGRCLPPEQICDGIADCPGGEDEVATYCGGGDCASTEFTCLDGTCIGADRICDGRDDCAGGEDERWCGESCGLTDVSCSDWSCIPREALCDGRSDCEQGEDERRCGGG